MLCPDANPMIFQFMYGGREFFLRNGRETGSAGFLTRVSCDSVARKSRTGKSVLPMTNFLQASQEPIA